MAWVGSPSTKKRRKKSSKEATALSSAPTTIEEAIEYKRADLKKAKAVLPDLVKDGKRLEREIKRCKGRHTIRRRKTLERELEKIQESIANIQSGSLDDKFKHTIAPYLAAAAALHTQPKEEDTPKPEKKRLKSDDKKKKTVTRPRRRKNATSTRTIRVVDTANARDSSLTDYNETSMVEELIASSTDTRSKSPPLYMVTQSACPHCLGTMCKIPSQAVTTCRECGYSCSYIDATSSSQGFDETVEYTSFSYKRQNHFKEWLDSVQAKESSEIPMDVLEQVMQKLHSNRITDPNKITNVMVRQALKELKLRRYYENVTLISCLLSGKRPPRLSPEQETQLKLMFMSIQRPFDRNCPPTRKNFLSYSYTCYKFCELIGLDEFMVNFSLLKGRDKLHKQDCIWKKITEELDWQYIPSV